ncbi:hypothetical protein [Nostoc sp.]|uniref:hypothetical protein n=1 Tax=Nostoc sp. TaxID=1180 RepID=UPI0035948D73
MHSTHCALAVIREKYFSLLPDSAIAPLETAIQLSEKYHKTWWSIWWNSSNVRTKNRIKEECNHLAFDCYTAMMQCAIAINTHAITQSALNIKPPKLWAAIIKELSLAFEWIEKDNYSEINQRQLILNLENPTMTRFSAIAHTRANYNYSPFHQSLLHENNGEDYALRHIYSLENTKVLLTKWGWSAEEIKAGIDHATIDVYKNQVYLHISNKISKRGQLIKIRGISRFISKADFVSVLIERCWSKADPYKLQPGDNWDELVAMGNTGDFYELKLHRYEVTCTCHAYSGIEKAFAQDAVATKHLMLHDTVKGQIPDKHIFAVWKYLGAQTLQQYEYCWMERKEAAMKEQDKCSWQYDPEPELSDW